MLTEIVQERLYPSPKYDGTLRFYEQVRRALLPGSRVLNLGAGPATGDARRILKGLVKEGVQILLSAMIPASCQRSG
jgi:hypothetical protein